MLSEEKKVALPEETGEAPEPDTALKLVADSTQNEVKEDEVTPAEKTGEAPEPDTALKLVADLTQSEVKEDNA